MTDSTKFITVEGIDGSGKSTYIPELKKIFEDLGEEVVLTREPGGTDLAERLREVILNDKMDIRTEILLAFASRNEHITKVIRPALDAGKVVISDRFTDSTYAYQGYAGGGSLEEIKILEDLVQQEIQPELTFIFMVPTEVSKERLSKTGKNPDKFESKEDGFFNSASFGYAEKAKENPERYKIIDSSLSIEETRKQVIKHLNEYIKKLEANKTKKFKMQ